LILAKMNIGEFDSSRPRQLRVLQCIRDGSVVRIDAPVELPCPCGDDWGDLLEPV
jgi:hypothetical protein